jgi:hypothetical protein
MAGRITGTCAGFCCMVNERSAGGYLLTYISPGFNISPHLMEHHQVGYAIIYAYYVLHSSYMFQHYYLAIFRKTTPTFL